MPRTSNDLKSGRRFVSLSDDSFERLTRNLPRDPRGRVIGVVSALDRAINAAIDAETKGN